MFVRAVKYGHGGLSTFIASSSAVSSVLLYVFFFQAEDGIRDHCVTGVQTCALPIFLLSRYQGLSYAEIAQISGCSEGAVKTRVFRAMEVLKKALTGDGRGGNQCLNEIGRASCRERV